MASDPSAKPDPGQDYLPEQIRTQADSQYNIIIANLPGD